MRFRRAGVASSLLGSAALALTATAKHWQSFIFVRQGLVLDWLDWLGLVRQPQPEAFNSVSPPGFLSLHDEKALAILSLSGVVVAVASIVLALVAEWRRESSLYLGAGVICSAGALLLWEPLVGLLGLVIAGVSILGLRRARQA
jgi:hypothetical protein